MIVIPFLIFSFRGGWFQDTSSIPLSRISILKLFLPTATVVLSFPPNEHVTAGEHE